LGLPSDDTVFLAHYFQGRIKEGYVLENRKPCFEMTLKEKEMKE
jgi:hypothetical protein